MLHGIEPFKFDARICRAELPVHRTDLLVAMLLPALNLLTKLINRSDIVRQTLPRQHAPFDLSNIEPTRMFRGVVDLYSLGQGMRLSGRKDFVERGRGVRIRLSITTTTFAASGYFLQAPLA